MKDQEIKVEVTYTDGYEKRFTEACLRQLKKRQERAESEAEIAKRKTA